jgi:RluA family pseudouridine synthase
VDRYLKSMGVNEPVRVIHRLDLGTSGVMFFPKRKPAATHISAMLKGSKVEKVYWALVAGNPKEETWTVNAPIGRLSKFRCGVVNSGREARTSFRTIARGEGAALVEARPLTGRTHQIRVHLAHLGFPVVGDQTYGGPPDLRMMLHCRSMTFRARDGRSVAATAPVDEDFTRVCGDYGISLDNS